MKISKAKLFPTRSQTRHVLLFTTSICCPNGGPGIKPGKKIRYIKFEKEKQNCFHLQIMFIHVENTKYL